MASSRGNPDLDDIVRSMVVLGLIVLALYGVGQFFTRTPEQPTRSVDWQPAVESARRSADYPVLAPPSLPDGWRATSARYVPSSGTWTLGVLTDDEEYLGVEQSTASVTSIVDRVADGGEAAGSAQVADRVWSVTAGPDDRITYASRVDGVTTVVTGTTEQRDLEAYIGTLVDR